MNPILQDVVVAAIVLGALGYMISRFAFKRRSGKNCDIGCGCTSEKRNAPLR